MWSEGYMSDIDYTHGFYGVLAPNNIRLAADLKRQLAETRERVGDDGSHYPKCEAVVQEFWDYDEADRAKAREISHQYLERRRKELAAGKRNIRTWMGN